jgi:hypothetical protein
MIEHSHIRSGWVTRPRGLLCGDAEESVAVQPVARQHAEPTRRSYSDDDVLFALWSAQGRVEDRSGAGFDHGVAVVFDDEEPVEQ